MTKGLILASVSATAMAAFETKTGWKMDGDKLALDGDGNPIYVDASGNERVVKTDTIPNLMAENKQHRERAEKAENDLKVFAGIDADTARKAIETVGKLDAKKLIDAGEVDKVRDQVAQTYQVQLTEKDKALTDVTQRLNDYRVKSIFDGSEFLREKIHVPRDMFEATFRSAFKVTDNGEIEVFDRDGNRLLTKTGEYAKPGDDALQLLVERHPHRDMILKAPEGGGTGNNGGGGARGTGRTMKRADFDALDAHAKATAATSMGKGELTVVD